MELELRMLGTGGAFATRYDNTNALMACGGYTLLVDCGITAPRALHRMGIPFDAIDGVLITHLHGDHVGGLEEYAFQMLYVYKKKPVLWIPAELRGPIWEHTLKGCMENPGQQLVHLEDYFDVRELSAGRPTELAPGFTVELMPTQHIPGKPSFALYVNDGLYYSADSLFDPDRLVWLRRERGLTHILHECQLAGTGYVHTTLAELLTLPEELQELTLLMHYDDQREAYEGKTGRMAFLEQKTPYRFEL